MNRFIKISLIGIGLLLSTAAISAEQRYYFTLLGTLTSDNVYDTQPYSYATAINNLNQVVGYSAANAETYGHEKHAFLYEEGNMIDLGSLGYESNAYAINDAGQVIGEDRTYAIGDPLARKNPFIYQNGSKTYLESSASKHAPRYNSINENGQMVGKSPVSNVYIYPNGYTKPTAYHAFIKANGTKNDLGTLRTDDPSFSYRPDYTDSEATAINNYGQVVGYSETRWDDSSPSHAFVYENGKMKDLGNLTGGALSESMANDINDKGQIVGYSDTIRDGLPISLTYGEHAFLYEDGQMKDLGTLYLDSSNTWQKNNSYALAINNASQVVGYIDRYPLSSDRYSSYGVVKETAFLYENGEMVDLNDLVFDELLGDWNLRRATDINDSGIIVGEAYNLDTKEKAAFILTEELIPGLTTYSAPATEGWAPPPSPVPEPSSYAMMGLGLLGLITYSRKRKLH